MTRLSALMICAAIAVPTTAAAEDTPLEAFRYRMIEWERRDRRESVDADAPFEQCFRDIADAKAAGVTGTQRLDYFQFKDHPRAGGDLAAGYWITVDDASYYCERYKNRALFSPHFAALNDAAHRIGSYSAHLQPGEHASTTLAACYAAAAAAEQAGVPPDWVVDLAGTKLPFARVRAEICDGLAASMENAKRAAAELRTKYEKYGAKGERLEMLVAYDGMYWTLPGGARTDDPRTLAKAKVLFDLLEDHDPVDNRYVIHTVRKYTFKGHKATHVDQTYRSVRGMRPPAKAFR